MKPASHIWMFKVRSPDKFKPDQLLIIRPEEADGGIPSNVRCGELAYLFIRPNQKDTTVSSRSPPSLLVEEGDTAKQFKAETEFCLGAVVMTSSFQMRITETARGLPIHTAPHPRHTCTHTPVPNVVLNPEPSHLGFL